MFEENNNFIVPESVDEVIKSAIKRGQKMILYKKTSRIALLITFILAVSVFGTCFASPSIASKIPFIGGMFMQPTKVSDIVNKYKSLYPDNYGGAYIDENGTLTINIVGDESSVSKDPNVIYHKVKYTLFELQNAADKLTEKMLTLDIVTIGVDEEKNKVIVTIKEMDPQTIDLIIKTVANPDLLEITQQDPNLKIVF